MPQLSSVQILYIWNLEGITIIIYKVKIRLDLPTYLAFSLFFTSGMVWSPSIRKRKEKVFMFALMFEC